MAPMLAVAADSPVTAAQPPRLWQAVLINGFSIGHARREQIGAITRLWIQADPSAGYVDVPTLDIAHFEQEEVEMAPVVPTSSAFVASTAAPPSYGFRMNGQSNVESLVAAAGSKHQIDPDFVASVVRAESGFNPRAVSPKGARGLMQLMPSTAAELGVQNSFDPATNVDGGTRYLRGLLDQYQGDAARALAAYNAGPHRVMQYGGVPPYRETRAYVSRVIREYNRKKIAADPSLAISNRGIAKKQGKQSVKAASLPQASPAGGAQ
jgi:hypothetical protein